MMVMCQLNEHGILPEGLHSMTMEEIGEVFGRFQNSDRRQQLYLKLQGMVEHIRHFDFIIRVIVDGSFVTAKNEPEDIDLIFCVDDSVRIRLEAGTLNPFEYAAVSSRRLRKLFGFDVLVAPENSSIYESYMSLFSRHRGGPDGTKKGLVHLKYK